MGQRALLRAGARVFAIVIGMTVGSGWASAESVQPPAVESEAAILIEQRTGEALFVKNGDERLYPASITKIATAILAIEHTSPDDIVTVSKTARGEEGTRVYLAEGEQVTMEKLLYGMMLNSGNDAATAIAEHIDGTKEKFAERMNEFMSRDIGADDTHFVNPSGLPDPDHYTTASDMAKLARYAMNNDTFRRIVATRAMPWAGLEWTSALQNHNRLLTDYPGATGIKNGYTIAAGNTLVGSAERDGMSLIGVVLKAGSKEKAYADMKAMLDYGFANFAVKLLFADGERYERPADEMEAASGWIAQAPIWGVYSKQEQPQVEVAGDGAVTLSSAGLRYEAGRLAAVKKEVAISSFTESGADKEKAAAGGQPANSSGSRIAAWACLALLAPAAAFAVVRLRRSRDKSRAAGRYDG